jgi:hypothetical protein
LSSLVFEFRRQRAVLILDAEDRFLREQGIAGPHPRPLGTLNFSLVGRRVGGVFEAIEPPIVLEVTANPSGYHLFFGKEKVDGGRRNALLSEGTYVLRVEAALYQTAEIDIEIETLFSPMSVQPGLRAPYFVDLSPGYAYPFPQSSVVPGAAGPTLLRGAVRSVDGQGIAGVEVEVIGQTTPYRTGSNGQWVLAFPETLASGNVTVQFRFPNGPVQNIAGVPIRQGLESSLPQAALRGTVFSRGAGSAGAVITVSGHAGEARTQSDGGWFFYFDLDQVDEMVSVTATLPDGSSLVQAGVPVRRRATSVVPAFRFP